MSEDNITKILVAVISALIPGLITLIVERNKLAATQERPVADGKDLPGMEIDSPAKLGSLRRKSALWWTIPVGLAIGLLIWMLWPPKEMLLWTFEQSPEGWQPERHDVKPEDVATQVGWTSPGWLQGEFDFSQVNPENLSGKEPRATYYVDPVKAGDWSAFQTLNFDVNNTSGHDLKVTFSISINDCWYEFGTYQPLPKGQLSSLKFDLMDAQYKTCRVPDRKDNPPVTFDAVWRFDIVFGTPEEPFDQVKGSVLIDNIKLTDRIPDAK